MANEIVRSQFVIPELLADNINIGQAGKKIFMGSPAVVFNPTLPTQNRGGDVVKVPYLGNLGAAEILSEAVALTPTTLTSESETATVVRAGKAIEMTRWAEYAAAYTDPYATVGAQMQDIIERAMEAAIITAAAASLPAMTYTVPGSGTLDYDAVVKAKAKWGDEVDNVVMLAMHSKPFFDLLQLKDSTGRPLAVETVQADGSTLRSFAGLPVYVSDLLAADSGTYTTLLCKRASLLLWSNPAVSVDEDKNILKHTQLLAINAYFAAYRYKYIPGMSKGGIAMVKSK